MEQNVDFLQTATIVENPSNLEGRWTSIECLTSLTGVKKPRLPNSLITVYIKE